MLYFNLDPLKHQIKHYKYFFFFVPPSFSPTKLSTMKNLNPFHHSHCCITSSTLCHVWQGGPDLKKVQKNLFLRSFLSSMVYWSGKIPLVLSQAASPLCSSTMKYTKEIVKNTKEKRNQDILVFGTKNNLVEYIRWLAAFLRS